MDANGDNEYRDRKALRLVGREELVRDLEILLTVNRKVLNQGVRGAPDWAHDPRPQRLAALLADRFGGDVYRSPPKDMGHGPSKPGPRYFPSGSAEDGDKDRQGG